MKVIKVENVSKQYRLGYVGSNTIRDDLSRWWHGVLGKENPMLKIGESNDRSKKGESDYVWALKDINFEVEQGEVLGIIGRNGAGKSTLLKILSKVTAPTTGSIKVKGRIASLLEVGTGFNPELTGRENIFLNGAILGMRKWEIQKKLDEIVDFAGVERYIDTPVKRYSSGMYVRLAFAVAAHLEPEILIVDEVLAVGDAEFQKKCLGKMKDVSGQGRTVLFVSHNMAAIQNLCSHVMVLSHGTVGQPKTNTEAGIQYYNQSVASQLSFDFSKRTDRQGSGKLRFTGISFFDKDYNEIVQPICGQHIIIRLPYKVYQPVKNIAVAIGFNSWSGENKFILGSDLVGKSYGLIEHNGHFECEISRFPLSAGSYLINVFAKSEHETIDWIQEAASIDIENGDFYGTGKNLTSNHQSVLINHVWK